MWQGCCSTATQELEFTIKSCCSHHRPFLSHFSARVIFPPFLSYLLCHSFGEKRGYAVSVDTSDLIPLRSCSRGFAAHFRASAFVLPHFSEQHFMKKFTLWPVKTDSSLAEHVLRFQCMQTGIFSMKSLPPSHNAMDAV